MAQLYPISAGPQQAARPVGRKFVATPPCFRPYGTVKRRRALVAKRDSFVAEARDKAPPKASSFDRVVEDTLKAQIKR